MYPPSSSGRKDLLKKAEEELAPRATAEQIAAVRAKIDEALAFESKVYTMTTFVALRSILSDINPLK